MPIAKFADAVKDLFEHSAKKKQGGEAGDDITIKDRDDAINIARSIATRGGSQTYDQR